MFRPSQVDVVALQETWLNENIADSDVDIKGFSVFRTDRKHSQKEKGGGVLLYVSNNFCERKTRVVKQLANDNLDLIAVLLNEKIVIVSVYVNHTYNKSAAVETISEVANDWNSKHIFICGDMNRAPIRTALGIHGLTNVVQFPTRKAAFLDQIWTNAKQDMLIVEERAKLGDHKLISVRNKYSKYGCPRKWKKRKVFELNEDKMRCELETTDWNVFTAIEDLDDMCETITAYVNFCERSCYTDYTFLEDEVTGQVTTSEIKHARRRRERAFRLGDDDQFKHWSKIANEKIAELQGKILLQLRMKDSRQYWKTMKTTAGITKERLKLDGNLTLDDLNEFFLRYEKKESLQMPANVTGLNTPPPNLTDDDVVNLLRRLKSKNARGSDGMACKTLRTFRNELKNPVGKILNGCLSERRIPKSWTKIKITPEPKGNTQKVSEPKQVRPIGQTPALLKVLEYKLLMELKSCRTEDLDKQQFAYKTGVSTADALEFVIEQIVQGLAEEHTVVRVLYLDYSSAFNTISRQEILDLIADKLQASPWLVEIMFSYLQERQQYVTLLKEKSNEKSCCRGVIQGAVLSPFLFTLITDDLRSKWKKINYVKFSDDTCVIAKIQDNEDFEMYQNAVNEVEDWSNIHSLSLNPPKTYELEFCNKNFKNPFINKRIMVGNELICPQTSVRHLGIHFDQKLKFDIHVSKILKSVKGKIFQAIRLMKGCRRKVIVKDFVLTCIIPVLTYCFHIYCHFLTKKLLMEIKNVLKYLSKLMNIKLDEFIKYIEMKVNDSAIKMFKKNVTRGRRGKVIMPRVLKAMGQKTLKIKSLEALKNGCDYFCFP